MNLCTGLTNAPSFRQAPANDTFYDKSEREVRITHSNICFELASISYHISLHALSSSTAKAKGNPQNYPPYPGVDTMTPFTFWCPSLNMIVPLGNSKLWVSDLPLVLVCTKSTELPS